VPVSSQTSLCYACLAAGIHSVTLLVASNANPLRWASRWLLDGGSLSRTSLSLAPPRRLRYISPSRARASIPLRCSSSPKSTHCIGLDFGSTGDIPPRLTIKSHFAVLS
jgi:hypothetical protein